MAVDDDAIGLVRQHRWADVELQRARLEDAGCKTIIDLGETKREDALRLIRDKWVGKLVYAFLLADPRRRHLVADFRAALAKIEDRGGVIKDLSTGLDTADKSKRIGLLAVVKDQIRRSQQGKRSAINGTKNPPGRQLVKFTPEQYREAKAIWRDTIDYPTWEDAEKALRQISSAKGEEFTPIRAVRKWGKRTRR
jgi:hypothetical protein